MIVEDICKEECAIAIQFSNEKAKDNVASLLQDFSSYGIIGKAIVFYAYGTSSISESIDGLLSVQMPKEADNYAKQKNFIMDWMKSNSFHGFLHIIEDNVKIDKDPREYINKVQHAMDVLDYSIYFSTVTDPCNYVFKKFCPRLTLKIDDEAIQSKLALPTHISFTSHSNTAWTIYDFNKSQDIQKYDERFGIAMFYIIEYLSRRKASRGTSQLYFMNQYLSIVDEIGVYHIVKVENDKPTTPQQMKDEDTLFKSMNVDYAPDNNIDQVLDIFYTKVKEKMA